MAAREVDMSELIAKNNEIDIYRLVQKYSVDDIERIFVDPIVLAKKKWISTMNEHN